MTIREELEAARAADLLTVRQLALLSQYNEQTIYRKAKRGEIPGRPALPLPQRVDACR
jgi:predicted DNA-binding transcriptional regulator AlpA